jgi:hypothetical protein
VPKPAGAALLIQPPGPPQRHAARVAGARPRAVTLSAVADPAQVEEALAVRPDTDDQPQRIHALPRSGRGGWTSTKARYGVRRRERRLARSQGVMPPEGPGWSDSGPSPPTAVGENDLPQFITLGNRRPPVANSALLGDRQVVDDRQKARNPERSRKSGAIVAVLCRARRGRRGGDAAKSGPREAQSSHRAPDHALAVRPSADTPSAIDPAGAPRQAGRVFRVFTGRATQARLSNTDAKKSELLAHGVSGGFPQPIYEAFRRDPQVLSGIARQILDAHFPSSIHDDILEAVGLDLDADTYTTTRKAHDPAFRERVLRVHEFRCATCELDIRLGRSSVGVEAAHVMGHQAGGPDIEPKAWPSARSTTNSSTSGPSRCPIGWTSRSPSTSTAGLASRTGCSGSTVVRSGLP